MSSSIEVIMVSCNTCEKTARCLALLLKYTDVPFHIWVIDNASTDGSQEMLRTYQHMHPACVTVIENTTNVGYAPAIHQVYVDLHPTSDLCYVNSDVYVGPQWTSRLQRHLMHDPQIAAVAPIGRGIGGRQDLDHQGREWAGNAYSEAVLLAVNATLESVSPCAVTAKTLQGTLLYIRRSAHEEIGGLDPECICGADDADWCLRARLAGWKLVIALDTFVWHDDHSSFRRLEDQGEQWIDCSWAYFNQKWAGRLDHLTWGDLMENATPTDDPVYRYEEF